MRWPLSLLFRGDRDAPAAADADAAGPGAPGGTAGPNQATGLAPAADIPPRPAAWRSLPPVQRSFGDAPLTAPAVPFGRELAGRRPPDPILHPLAHDLAADGPAGLVSGIATPLPAFHAPAAAPAAQAELPPSRGVQRRSRTVSRSAAPLPAGEGPGTLADAPPAAPAVSATGLPTAPLPRVLAVVAPSAAVTALAATRVGASTAPEPARAAAPTSGAAPSGPAGSSVQRSAASPVAPAAAPLVASPTVADTAPDAGDPAPGADLRAARPAPPHSLGESRRLGLGAPLARRPSVQRAVDGPDLPLARQGRAGAPPTPTGAVPPPPRRAAAAEAALPILRVASEGGRPAMPPGPAAARHADWATAEAPTAPVDAETGGELAGPTTPSVQRSGERPLVGDAGRRAASASADEAEAAPGGEPGAGLPLAAGTGFDGGTVAPGGSPGGDPAAGPPPGVIPAAAPPPMGLSAGLGQSALPVPPAAAPPAPAERWVPLVVARLLRGPAPLRPGTGAPAAPPEMASRSAGATGTAPDPASAAAAQPAQAASISDSAASGWPVVQQWPVVQRSPVEDGAPPDPGARPRRPSLPVARAAAAPGPPGPAGSPSAPVAISRLLGDGTGSAPPLPARAPGWSAGSGFSALPAFGPAMVQRSVVIDEVATAVEPAPVAGGPAGGSDAAGTGGAGAGAAGQDYEEIADRVYDRIRSRFATELLLDRERMGLLIDG